MIDLPSITPIRPNLVRVNLPEATLWFSYRTLVAFSVNGISTVRRNDWGPTTGKHLNYIDSGSPEARADRVNGETFQRLWNERTSAAATV
jgi:hypothetical protein